MNLVQRLRMRGALPPLLRTSAWHGVHLSIEQLHPEDGSSIGLWNVGILPQQIQKTWAWNSAFTYVTTLHHHADTPRGKRNKLKGILVYFITDVGNTKKDGPYKQYESFFWVADNILQRITWLFHWHNALNENNLRTQFCG